MAAQKALNAQPPACDDAIPVNGVIHVAGTSWIKNTIFTEQGGDHDLVKADEFQEQVAHLISPDFLAQ